MLVFFVTAKSRMPGSSRLTLWAHIFYSDSLCHASLSPLDCGPREHIHFVLPHDLGAQHGDGHRTRAHRAFVE